LILFLYPSIVLVFAALRSRRRIAAREWQAMALGYLGIACVFAGDAGHATRADAAVLGALCVFASSVAYSGYLVLAEGVVTELGSVRFTGLAMCSACLVSISHFALTAPAVTQISARALGLCAMMACFSTVLPTWLLSEAVRRIGAGRAALCGMIGPVTTVVLEVLLLGETARLTDALGTALVIASVVRLTRSA
jgi:drug/metabolite transporter (DMT)-like permease